MSKQFDRMESVIGDNNFKVRSISVDTGMLRARMDQLLHLMKEMVSLEGHIDEVEGRILSRLDKLAASQVDSGKLVDRLIEMSMVTRGQSQDAVIHRSQARIESNFSDQNSWTAEEETPEDTWPPPGCDAMDVRG